MRQSTRFKNKRPQPETLSPKTQKQSSHVFNAIGNSGCNVCLSGVGLGAESFLCRRKAKSKLDSEA